MAEYRILSSGGITIIREPGMKFASVNISSRSFSVDLHPGNTTGGMFRFSDPDELKAHIALLTYALGVWEGKRGTSELPANQDSEKQ